MAVSPVHQDDHFSVKTKMVNLSSMFLRGRLTGTVVAPRAEFSWFPYENQGSSLIHRSQPLSFFPHNV